MHSTLDAGGALPLEKIEADWPAPSHIHAFTTTRAGGVSTGPYAGLNLGERCGDQLDSVLENRRRLGAHLSSCVASQTLTWLHQVHGTQVVELPIGDPNSTLLEADGAWSQTPQQVCAVLTADCLPVLFCDQQGTRVAAAHAGWRGLLNGVLERTVEAMSTQPDQIMAWLGPAISQSCFEVGPEVIEAFIAIQREAEQAFLPGQGDRWYADLYSLARLRLRSKGVEHIYGEPRCTFSDEQRFYSFRRDHTTGRMASLIWFDAPV